MVALRHREHFDRRAQMLATQFQQDPPRFGGHPAHRPAIAFDAVGTARAALVRRDVRAAHHEAGLVVGDVQFVAHHLPERSARALAAIGLADEERCGVVGMNHDPGVELQKVGIGIGAGWRLRLPRRARQRRAECVTLRLMTSAPEALRKLRREA